MPDRKLPQLYHCFFNRESCPKDGCPSNKILQQVPKLGPDDTVIVLLHGNAKVNNFKFFSPSK